MKCVLFVAIFDAKVINNKDKRDVACVVLPKPGCVTAFVVAVGSEALAEKVVGKDSGLGKAVHTFSYFCIYPSVGDKLMKIVFSLNFRRDVVDVEADVFIGWKGCAEVKVANIHAHIFGNGIRNSAVEVNFGSGEVGSSSADVTGIVN